MSSKSSQAYAQMKTILAALFTSSKNIPNAYALESAPGTILNNGFGVTIGPSRNRRDQMSCNVDLERDFALVLTRRITTTSNNAEDRLTLEQELIDDQLLMIKAFDQNTTLNGVVADCTFIGDSGIELLSTDSGDGKYFVIISIVTCRYIESLN